MRKRKVEEKEDDEEEEAAKLEEGKRRPRYGRDMRSLPGDEDDDLDALLGSTTGLIKRPKIEPKESEQNKIKGETPEQNNAPVVETESQDEDKNIIKTEDPEPISAVFPETTQAVLADPEPSDVGSIFKKRKKPIRPR